MNWLHVTILPAARSTNCSSMKTPTSIRLLLAILMLAMGTIDSRGLTPGPTIIRECPHCKKPLQQITIGSGNNFGAKWWTDGRMVAHGMPFWPGLGKCPLCGTAFWIDDARQLGLLSWQVPSAPAEAVAQWTKAPVVGVPSEADLLAAASAPGITKEREREARMWAWWNANDAVRQRVVRTITWNDAQRKNLERLSTLVDVDNECNVILQSEIARELGQFEACLKILKQPFKDKNCQRDAGFIRKLAQAKKTLVTLYPESTETPPNNKARKTSARQSKRSAK